MHVPVDRQTCHVISGTNRATRQILGVIIIVALFGLLATQATAASFDCKKAASWAEKTVCSNPELSKLDEQMAKAYHDAMVSLSPEGQKETKKYQKQWLKDRQPYCEARLKLKNNLDNNIHKCLKELYSGRNEQLFFTLKKFPYRIFRNVYLRHWGILNFKEIDTPDEMEDKNLSYLQIENPCDENEKLWNKVILKKAHDDFKIDYDNLEYTVNFSNKHLISLQILSYAHGGSHGLRGFESLSWLLNDKRKLKASDLFDNKTNWRKKLTTLVFNDLKENDENFDKLMIKPSKITNVVTSADNWVIAKEGLGIQFGEYLSGIGPYTVGAPLITIDWKTLNPYLSRKGHSLIND